MTTKANCYLGAIALAIGVIGNSQAQAQDRPAVLVDISACIELPSRAARNTCYEAVADEARALRIPVATEPPATAVVEQVPAAPPLLSAAPRETADKAVENFGTSTPAEAASVVDGAEGQAELHDRITNLQEREPGRWLITLASGQVWYQSNSRRIRLRKDMEVRIYPSPLGGSFRLAGIEGSTGFIQVTRVK